MKSDSRIFYILFFLLCSINNLFGQSFSGLGLKLGPNASWFRSTPSHGELIFGDRPAIESRAVYNYTVGVFLGYDLNEIFALQSEVQYSRKGGKLVQKFSDGKLTETWNVTYIEFPILIKYYLKHGKQIRPSIHLGVSPSWHSRGADIFGTPDPYKSSDFGLILGSEVDFKLGKGHALCEMRYTIGMTKVYTKDGRKNNTASVLVGYSIW